MAKETDIKKLAIAILKNKGIEHDEWLNEKYTQIIMENTQLLMQGLNIKKELEEDKQFRGNRDGCNTTTCKFTE